MNRRGRGCEPAEIGFSTLSTAFLYLGRDFRSAALGGYDENPVLSCTKKHLNIKKWCPLIILCVMPRDSGNTLQGTPLLYY